MAGGGNNASHHMTAVNMRRGDCRNCSLLRNCLSSLHPVVVIQPFQLCRVGSVSRFTALSDAFRVSVGDWVGRNDHVTTVH